VMSVAVFSYALFSPFVFGQQFWQLDPGYRPTMLVAVGVAAVGAALVELTAWLLNRRPVPSAHPAAAT
jgi:cation-transporting P-type ATPase E